MRKKYLGDSGTDIGFPTDPNSETSPDIDPSLFLDLKMPFSLILHSIYKAADLRRNTLEILAQIVGFLQILILRLIRLYIWDLKVSKKHL